MDDGFGLLLESAFFGLLALPALVVVLLIVFTGRGDPDPDGRRPYAAYLASVCFVSLFIALFAAFGVATSVADIPLDNDDGSFSAGIGSGALEPDPDLPPGFGDAFRAPAEDSDDNDPAIRSAVQALLVTMAAVLALAFHGQRMAALRDEADLDRTSAVWRVRQTYLWSVCFLAVLIALFAGANALYGLFKLAAPGVFEADGRGDGGAQLVTSGLLAAAAALIFARFWARAQPRRDPRGTEPPNPQPPPVQPPADFAP